MGRGVIRSTRQIPARIHFARNRELVASNYIKIFLHWQTNSSFEHLHTHAAEPSKATTCVIWIRVSWLKSRYGSRVNPLAFAVWLRMSSILPCLAIDSGTLQLDDWELRHGLYCITLWMVQEFEAGRLLDQRDGWRSGLRLTNIAKQC